MWWRAEQGTPSQKRKAAIKCFVPDRPRLAPIATAFEKLALHNSCYAHPRWRVTGMIVLNFCEAYDNPALTLRDRASFTRFFDSQKSGTALREGDGSAFGAFAAFRFLTCYGSLLAGSACLGVAN
jgi:hypothetical protein